MMYIKITLSIFLMICSVGFGHYAQATDAELKIKGTIKPSPCKVAAEGGNINVDLGQDIFATKLSSANSGSEWKNFTLRLVDCPKITTSVTATFRGVPADESEDLYKNTNSAKSVQIELQEVATGKRIGNGKTISAPVLIENYEANFDLRARVYSSTGGAKAGKVMGIVQVEFLYQ